MQPQTLFQIEYLVQHGQHAHLIARQLEAGDFHVLPISRLGGISIKPSSSQPRNLTADGIPDLTVFAFALANSNDLSILSVGQLVELSEE